MGWLRASRDAELLNGNIEITCAFRFEQLRDRRNAPASGGGNLAASAPAGRPGLDLPFALYLAGGLLICGTGVAAVAALTRSHGDGDPWLKVFASGATTVLPSVLAWHVTPPAWLFAVPIVGAGCYGVVATWLRVRWFVGRRRRYPEPHGRAAGGAGGAGAR